ncbi:MAG: hypothetical protein QXS81_01305 [Candidatus Micrarchaeaceae archaeon]
MKSKKQRRKMMLLAIIIAAIWAIPAFKITAGLPLTWTTFVEIVLIAAGICGLTALTLNMLEARK